MQLHIPGFNKKRGIYQVNRRLFIRGAAGVLVGLPLLEGLLPKQAAADEVKVRYAIFLRQGNGVAQGQNGTEPDRFWPTKLGALTTASMKADGDQAVNVLADHADKLLIVRGLQYNGLGVDVGCGHSRGGVLCLTAAKPDGKTIEKALALGESIDNRIVRELQPAGQEPLTLRSGPRSGYLDDVLSYRGPSDRRTAEQSPYNAYKALFGVEDGTASEQELLKTRRTSVNDFIRGELGTLLQNSKLSKDDRQRLEHHQQAIRDLETGLTCKLPPEILAPIAKLTSKDSLGNDLVDDVTHMQMQVIALAVACGLSRAATLQVGNGNDQTQYFIDGERYERFHHISHRINSDGAEGTPIADADVKHHNIDKHFAGYFKYLIEQLKSYTTPTGTVLDEGVSVWLNDLSSGPPHGSNNLPYVLAGGAGGFLKTGQYVEAASGKNYMAHNRFLSTIGAAVGCKNASGAPLDDFGDASLPKGLVDAMLA
jgi:Protein of unknown function (DUF1552)